MFGPLLNVFSGLWGYVAAAAVSALVAAYGSWYVTHGLDGNAYKALQLAEANRIVAQQQADAASLAAFQVRSGAAVSAAEKAAQEARSASQAKETKLRYELDIAEKKDAPLARCLGTKLPDGILRDLAR